jgi:dsDNA-specific endonuclease/ATPase MutS2
VSPRSSTRSPPCGADRRGRRRPRHASPALRHIRERLRKQRARLRGTLESYLRGRDTAKYLQEQVITERNGRYVILVRAEHRGSIPGIVHGSSASGATLFVEPLGTVEVNNEIVASKRRRPRRSTASCSP